MRKNRFLFVAMLFAALSFGFASCDNKGNEPDDLVQGGQTDQGSGEETPTPADPYNGHVYVDLGLPSGLKWATCNVGATTPEGYGDYFAWGEVEPKEVYVWSTYKWMTTGMSSWKGINKYTIADGETDGVWYDGEGNFIGDNKTVLDPEDDAAAVNMGGSWRMPTYDELNELRTNCTWTWTTQNSVKGYLVTSKTNGNSIFLPAAGYRYDSDLDEAGSYGNYWSSSLDTDGSNYACNLGFYSDDVDWYSDSRYYGRSVRGVFSK